MSVKALTPRSKAITVTLTSVYDGGGKPSTMVKACAQDLDYRWDRLVQRAADADDPERGLDFYVAMLLWNWFSGGDTADFAAKQVCAAVANLNAATA